VLYSQKPVSPLPFNQAAVKQSTAPALQGPVASKPYFHVRFAHPIQPDNDEHANGSLVGIDKGVHDYHQSPAFEIMPNGDVLAIPYSGLAHREGGHYLHLVQSRLRYGAEEFDMPEEVTVEGVRMSELLQPDGRRQRHGPPLMWREGNTVWLFTDVRPYPTEDGSGFWGLEPFTVLFRVFKSMDNGATWTTVAAQPKFFDQNGIELGKPGSKLRGFGQPITSAFRDSNGHMLVAVDGNYDSSVTDAAHPNGFKNTSLLFRSPDNGLTWYDQGGNTSGRHSTIVPLNSNGRLLSLGGKDTSWDPVKNIVLADGSVREGGYMPQNISTDWGKTWQAPTGSPFPWLGANQRPCVIKLTNGNLVMVGDSRHSRTPRVPFGWSASFDGPYVALSTNNGESWTIKELPVALKHVRYWHKTIGYSTVRQAPNGVIHLLTTRTHPMLHYEFNEAWITTPTAGDILPETTGGTVGSYSETYPSGAPKADWSARITPNGRYLLDGPATHYYPDGKKQLEVTWVSGRRTGTETLWGPDGTKIWSWNHDLANNVSVWTHWWPNGQKRLESQWDTNPVARDLPTRHFRGLVSNGTARHWNMSGQLVDTYTFLNGVRIVPRGNYTENFSTDPSGRGWTGSGNTAGGNDIRWSSNTKWAEYRNASWYGTPGEISAVFARSSAYQYYADTSIGAKNRTQTLHISGNWVIKEANYHGTFRIGYFNKANPGSNFIGLEFREPGGVRIDPTVDNSGKLFRAFLSVKGAGGTTSTVPIEPHMVEWASFDLIWKGNPDGSGTLSGTVTGRPISITVDAGSGSFDSFGILSGGDSSSDSTKKTDICYFDNLVYDKGIVTTYIVTYNANGANSGSVPSNQTKPHGVELPLSTSGNLVREGYTFDSWNTAVDGSGINFSPGSLYAVNADITLYAKWKKSARFRNRK